MNLRWAVTERGTYLHAALDRESAKGRTLCGKRYVNTGEWDWEEFDQGHHCSRCWNAAEKLKENE